MAGGEKKKTRREMLEGVMPESDEMKAKLICYAARALITFIRPKNSRYKLYYAPSSDDSYQLPMEYYGDGIVLRFDFEANVIIVRHVEHQIFIGWVTMPQDIREMYEERIQEYRTLIRPAIEGVFSEGTRAFASAASVTIL